MCLQRAQPLCWVGLSGCSILPATFEALHRSLRYGPRPPVLFRYHHEPRPAEVQTPPVPGWKGVDSDKEDEVSDEDSQPPAAAAPPAVMHHDDVLGEAIPSQEESWMQEQLLKAVWPSNFDAQVQSGKALRFPGAPPVLRGIRWMTGLVSWGVAERQWPWVSAQGTVRVAASVARDWPGFGLPIIRFPVISSY